MRAVLAVILMLLALAFVAQAVPVNPIEPHGVAAVWQGEPSRFYVLTVTGEVWSWLDQYNGSLWVHDGLGASGNMDPPVPVAQIADWNLWSLYTHEGAFWRFNEGTRTWDQLPPPPFTPVGAQQTSLGTLKKGYR